MRGQQWPIQPLDSTNHRIGFVTPKLVSEGCGVGRENLNRGLCCGFYSRAGGKTRVISDLPANMPAQGRVTLGRSAPPPTVPPPPREVGLCIWAQAPALQSSSWTRSWSSSDFSLSSSTVILPSWLRSWFWNMSAMVFSGSCPGMRRPLPSLT